MPIPSKKIKIPLSEATPSEMTVTKLKNQLDNIGLTCDLAAEKLLARYISTVKNQIPDKPGAPQAWGIYQPSSSNAMITDEVSEFESFDSATGLVQSAMGQWTPQQTALGYASDLEYIQYKDHFDWLKANRSSFTGTENTPPQYSGEDVTVAVIKQTFARVATDASSTLVKGINRDAIEAAMSNAIAPVSEEDAKDYDATESRVLFLVDNYDPNTGEADGIGVLNVTWTLKITNYKKKKGDVPLKHNYTLTITARSVVYDDIDVMNADLAAAKSHFKSDAFFAIPPRPTKLTVFPQRPPADQDTFNKSLPVLATGNKAEVIVLYAPDLQNIGSIDNSTSKATATYSKAVTSGFTFSMTQTLSVSASFEVSVEIIKAGIQIGLSLSFTEQWSKQTTETISFTVGGGEKAFTYQGYLMSALLTYDAATGRYSFGEAARFLSPILVTSDKPIEGATTMSMV